MNLHQLLVERERDNRPIRVGLIGSGRFGTMYLAQARNIPGIHVVAVADLDVEKAKKSFARVGWPEAAIARDIDSAVRNRSTAILDSAAKLFDSPIEVIVEATGSPVHGIDHALRAIDAGKHIIMVTVEAEALAGPAVARYSRKNGVVYSMAYGDQPALIMEMVDWARTAGFSVVCAGKGAKYLDGFHDMNPDNVWQFWSFPEELTASGQLNPYMHTSFRDGTKAAIEMAAVANAAGLVPSDDGITFTPGDVHEIATVCRPRSAGGVLAHEGSVDVMSSFTRDGREIPHNTQEGVFVVVKATNEYVSKCFGEYPWHPDPEQQYAALFRPYHYIGLELNQSIANAVLRGIPTGSPAGFYGDVVATAKKDLAAGEMLDGEGGFTVRGKLVSAKHSVATNALPVALSHGTRLTNDIKKGRIVSWNDVEITYHLDNVLRLRKETVEQMVETPLPSNLESPAGRGAHS
jgi:predicted homoserine dehydrogenase-like protein